MRHLPHSQAWGTMLWSRMAAGAAAAPGGGHDREGEGCREVWNGDGLFPGR